MRTGNSVFLTKFCLESITTPRALKYQKKSSRIFPGIQFVHCLCQTVSGCFWLACPFSCKFQTHAHRSFCRVSVCLPPPVSWLTRLTPASCRHAWAMAAGLKFHSWQLSPASEPADPRSHTRPQTLPKLQQTPVYFTLSPPRACCCCRHSPSILC